MTDIEKRKALLTESGSFSLHGGSEEHINNSLKKPPPVTGLKLEDHLAFIAEQSWLQGRRFDAIIVSNGSQAAIGFKLFNDLKSVFPIENKPFEDLLNYFSGEEDIPEPNSGQGVHSFKQFNQRSFRSLVTKDANDVVCIELRNLTSNN